MRVWLEAVLEADALARLKEAADVVESKDLEDLKGADAAVVTSLPAANGDFMDLAGPSLKVIARPGIGVDNVDIPAASERGILVINTPDAPTESTAEHAVGLLLSLAQSITRGDMQMRGADISRPALKGQELRGRTLGVIGFGRIGSRVAEICKLGLKMDVIAYDPYVPKDKGAPIGVKLVETMDDLLTQCEFLTIHCALTDETRGMIDGKVMGKLRKGALVVNASRGPVLIEKDLIPLLENGHLAGAALDVFEPEPPQPDNPLLKMDNVVVTPHIASFTDLGTQAMSGGVVDQLIQISKGEKPPNLLDPAVWPGRVEPKGV